MLRRLEAQLHDIRLGLRIRGARQREARALAQLGRAALATPRLRERAQLAEPVSRLEHAQTRITELRKGVAASLEADREDFAAVEPWMRPAVVVRGLLGRAVLRHRMACIARSSVPQYEALGAKVIEEPGLIHRLHIMPYLGDSIATARADLETARAERIRRLAAFGGQALPDWSARIQQEGAALGHALWAQLKPQLFPRASALAGLTVGWWIANTYTDSRWSATLHSLGIGGGGTRVVSRGTYHAMSFWLPLLAGAVCAYVGDRVAHTLRRRYASASAALDPSLAESKQVQEVEPAAR